MLIGRTTEAKAASQALGRLGMVVITGPAGIGKTTVARIVVEPFGSPAEGGALATLAWEPFLVFRRLLGTSVGHERAGVASMVLNAAPGAVLLDDLQWADAASLDVIADLAGRIPVVAVVRDGEPRSDATVEALAMLGATEIRLGPLDAAQARLVLDAEHPGLRAAERDRILSQAAGNPLLLRELPRSPAESADLTSALTGQLAAFDDAELQALRRLAVLGRPAAPELLGAGAMGITRSPLITFDDGLVDFGHGAVAERIVALAGDQVDDIRRDLAALVGGAEAAHLLAAAGDHAQARERALDIAATAELAERAELLALAVACAPDGSPDVDLRLEAAELFCDLSRFDRVTELCDFDGVDAVESRHRGTLRARAGYAAWMSGLPDQYHELFEAALDDLRGTDTPDEVYVLAYSTLLDTRVNLDGRPALERVREAVALADRIGEMQEAARFRLASVLSTSGESGWDELYRDCIALADERGDRVEVRTITTSLMLSHWMAGDSHEALRLALAEIEIGPHHPHDGLWLSLHAYGAMIGLLLGVDREVLAERHRKILDDEPVFRSREILATALGLGLMDLGRPDEAVAVMSTAGRGWASRIQDLLVKAWFDAEYAWLTGATDAAAQILANPAGGDPVTLNMHLAAGHTFREAGLALPKQVELVASMPSWKPVTAEWQALTLACGGRHREAVALFDAAATQWDGHDVRQATRCRWAAADESRIDGADDAVSRLDAVADLARRWGLEPIGERARSSLRSLGSTRRSRGGDGRMGLTAREERVLRLVGGGMSSKSIGATLSIAPSTVDSIVKSAMRKLGVSNRRAAAAVLAATEGEVQSPD